MSKPDARVGRQTLAKAAEITGGTQALRRRLHVSATLLTLWLSGGQALPTDIFLKAVDIVEEQRMESLKKDAG